MTDIVREDRTLKTLTWASWLLALVGVLGVVAGVIILVKPSDSLATLAAIAGIFLLVDGILELARDHDPLAIYPVDWEMAWIGPGSLDLAALGGGWGAVERESLARAYLDGVGATGPAHPDLEELSASLARCRLHLALQWLGWSPAWRPPPEHAHDWLGEAWELAQELGLAA